MAKLQAPLAKAAQQYDGNALQTLVAIMNDDTATTAARVRCAEFILDRAHGKPAYLQDPNRDPEFVPLAERLKWALPRTPITLRGSCARAGDTHAAAPPRRLMNSRRLMGLPHAEDYTLPHSGKKAVYASHKIGPLVSV